MATHSPQLRRSIDLTDLAGELPEGLLMDTAAPESPVALNDAALWVPGATPESPGTIIVAPTSTPPTAPETLEVLRTQLASGPPRCWALCGWPANELSTLRLGASQHRIIAFEQVDAATQVIAAVTRLTDPPNVTELRRLTTLQRNLSQALDHDAPVAELLRRLGKLTGAVCLVVDAQGRVQESVGSLPLSLFLQQIRRTDAESQQLVVEGWHGLALRVKDVERGDPSSGGWLIVAARRAEFPGVSDVAATHIVATLVESARRMQHSAKQQEEAIRSSIFDEALALAPRPDSPELASRLSALGFDFDAPLRVVALSGVWPASRAASQQLREPFNAALDAAGVPFLTTSREAAELYLVQAGADTVQRIFRMHHGDLDGRIFGIGRPIAEVSAVPDSYADALIAMRVIRAGRHHESHMSFEQFDFATRLFASVGLDNMTKSSRSFLAPLLEREPMLQALRKYFEVAQNTNAAADALGIHHNTLRYRLTKVEELLGVSLNEPAAVASLFLAITSLDLVESHPQNAVPRNTRRRNKGIPLTQSRQKQPAFGASFSPLDTRED